MNDGLLEVILWDKDEGAMGWDLKTPNEISLILQCGVIMNPFYNEDLITKPYRIVGHSYNLINKSTKKSEINIYIEEITNDVEFYRYK
ncbi:hypothetical protein JJB46_08490 [Clostridium perfringens]|uniref:hypothetical protein n=1 Tax=Clostridium perfringens TaxID=1502 RepID=UPI001ABA3729|nr:hypothetical protein [Clostridium perfringens]MBO3388301.1 hypothetical protein [Clostridium perfringens]MBO3413758.1 hypothetical protein [Clostridium perfringens]